MRVRKLVTVTVLNYVFGCFSLLDTSRELFFRLSWVTLGASKQYRPLSQGWIHISDCLFYWPFWGGPGVCLTLCCFVVYSTRRFVLNLALCYFVLAFSVLLPRLGKRELLLVLSYVCSICAYLVFLFLLGYGKGCGLWLWHSLDFSLTFFFATSAKIISARVIYLLTTDRQTVIYYSTNHAQELIYFDSNT